MKKLLSALVVLVVLLAGWTTASWYTGIQAEKYLAVAIWQINTESSQVKDNKVTWKISYKNYQRGIFSSQFQLLIKFSNPGLLFQPEIPLNGKLDHGPFPLSQLAKFNLKPLMMSLKTTPELSDNPLISEVINTFTKNKPLFTINSHIDYKNNQDIEINITPLNYSGINKIFDFAGGVIHLTITDDPRVTSSEKNIKEDQQEFSSYFTNKKTIVSVRIGKLTTLDLDSYEESVKVNSDGFSIDAELYKPASYYNMTGNSTINFDPITISINDMTYFAFNSVSLNSQSDITQDQKSINQQLKVNINGLEFKNQSIGTGEFVLQIKNINLHESNNLSKLIEKFASEGGTLRSLMENLPIATLSQNPPAEIHINPFNWHNDKGVISLNMALLFNDPQQALEQYNSNPDVTSLIKTAIKSLDGKLILPKAATLQILNQWKSFSHDPQDIPQQESAEQLEMLDQMGHAFNLTTLDGDNIVSELHYSDGKLIMNGNSISLDEWLNSVYH